MGNGMRDVTQHPSASRPENIDASLNFVFVSVDDGPANLLVVYWPIAKGIYVDCGMGLNRFRVGLSGFVRNRRIRGI